MGVVSIHQFPIPEGKSGPQAAEILQSRLETLGAVKAGTFCVDCETYYSAPHINNPPKSFHVVHNSEHLASVFSVTDSGTCLVTDVNMDMLMVKLSGNYSVKKAHRIESKGPRYELADFIVKIGSVCMGPSFKGILVEVEYTPCVVPGNCWDLMRELLQGFMGTAVQSPSHYLQGKMNEVFTPSDTIQQYMEHFNFFRRPTAVR